MKHTMSYAKYLEEKVLLQQKLINACKAAFYTMEQLAKVPGSHAELEKIAVASKALRDFEKK